MQSFSFIVDGGLEAIDGQGCLYRARIRTHRLDVLPIQLGALNFELRLCGPGKHTLLASGTSCSGASKHEPGNGSRGSAQELA